MPGVCVGRWLGLPQSLVDDIKWRFRNPIQRKAAYLDAYTHHHPCPSWKEVAGTLRECRLYKPAEDVLNTYVKGNECL